jgi:hypothetical protein
MNFFGHAWLAARARPDAAFVFGAMLPDLAAMAGLRVAEVAHASTDAGRRFHLATDAAFHRAESFQRLCVASTQALRAAGLRRGPARAIGHVGVELLLDGWLAAAEGVPALYGEALALGPELAPAISFRAKGHATPLIELCARIAGAKLAPDAWCEPERLAARLVRILAHRPLLALEARELPAVRAWAARARADVASAAPRLISEIGDVL